MWIWCSSSLFQQLRFYALQYVSRTASYYWTENNQDYSIKWSYKKSKKTYHTFFPQLGWLQIILSRHSLLCTPRCSNRSSFELKVLSQPSKVHLNPSAASLARLRCQVSSWCWRYRWWSSSSSSSRVLNFFTTILQLQFLDWIALTILTTLLSILSLLGNGNNLKMCSAQLISTSTIGNSHSRDSVLLLLQFTIHSAELKANPCHFRLEKVRIVDTSDNFR